MLLLLYISELYAFCVCISCINPVLYVFVAGLKKKGKRALELVNSQNSSDVTGADTRDNVSLENKPLSHLYHGISLMFGFSQVRCTRARARKVRV